MTSRDARSPLLRGVSQYEVDFVIPRLGIDLPLGIDPFLLFKSRDSEYRQLHDILVSTFNTGIDAVKRGETREATRILDFPEVPSIGMGYTRKGKRGSGVGTYLTSLIVESVAGSHSLQERGIRHVEEMQLLSAGIGPDRVSDIAANVLKEFLIEYTQRQSEIWSLPLKSGVPISHIYDHISGQWRDSYEDLPVSEYDGTPILLVPRRLVRALPWINYDDFLRTEFSAYLKARIAARRKSTAYVRAPSTEKIPTKEQVVTVTRGDISLVERYVRSREQSSAEARPALDYVNEDACLEAEHLKQRLAALRPGAQQAHEYLRLVLEILNYLFSPELIDGQPEVRTIYGTERRDIIFTNDSDESFWDYIRGHYAGILIAFEAKNVEELDIAAVNQTAIYLGDRVGRFGVIATRAATPEGIQRKIISVWNDSAPNRKVILTICDQEIREMLDLRCRGGSPTKWMQKHYRNFRTSLQ